MQNKALAVVLAAIIVTSMVAPFAAVGGAAAAPAGMSTIPDANVADDVPAGETIPLSASELEGGVMASEHADSLSVTLTTADHAASVMDADSAVVSGDGMALVLRDDQQSAGREVALDAGLLQQALGYKPQAIYGTHEDGSEWTASAEYVDGYLVFDVPHFSSNTVTFSGEVSIDASGATNGTKFEYELDEAEDVNNVGLELIGNDSERTESRTHSKLSDQDSIDLEFAGTKDVDLGLELTTNQFYEKTTAFNGAEWSATLSPSGDYLALYNGSTHIYDVSDWSHVAETSSYGEHGIAWKPNGEAVASLADDGTVEIYETNTWSLRDQYSIGSFGYTGFEWSSDGKWLAAGHADSYDGEVEVLNPATGDTEVVREGWDKAGTAWAAFSPDKDRMAVAVDGEGTFVFETGTWNLLKGGFGVGLPSEVTWSSSGEYIIIGDATESTAHVYDSETYESLWEIGFQSNDEVTEIATSPNSEHIAIGNKNGDVWVAELKDGGDEIAKYELGSRIRSLDYSNGHLTATSKNNGNEIYEYNAGAESPTVEIDGQQKNFQDLKPGDTAKYTFTGLSPEQHTANISLGGGVIEINSTWVETTETIDPEITVSSDSGTQSIGYSGILTDQEAVDLGDEIDESRIGGSTTITVTVDDPASGPAGQVDLNYSHSAQDQISTSYQATTFEESYNISHTYSDATDNAEATIPFASSRVVGVKNVEYRVDGGSWSRVAPANYRLDGTTLDIYLDDATGGVSAGQTVDVRATGRKISVDNGEVTVTDPTAPGEELDTELRVDSRTPDFAVNVGPTDDGDRVHYAYSPYFPTEDYVVIQANGDQDLYLPNAVTGDRFRVRHLDTRVVAERGDVRIDVVKAGENPELDVSPGPGGAGDPVTVEYYNTETGVKYLLNSLTRSIVVDSDVAESPAIFEDDDSEDTWAILTDTGATTTASGGGGGGIMPTQVSSAASSVSLPLGDSLPTPLLIVGVLGLGAVVVFRRFNPFGGGSSSTTSRSTSRSRSSGGGTDIPGLGAVMGVFGGIRSVLSMIPFSRVVGVVWDTLFGIVSSVARVLWNALRGAGGWLAASTASSARSAGGWVAARLATPAIALGVIAIGVMAAVQAGIIAPPREVRLMLAAISALIGSAIALRAVGLLNWRFYGIVAGSTFVIIAETLSPGSVLDALGSGLEQTFPIFGLVIAYLVYRRVRGSGGDDSGTTVVVTGGDSSDSSQGGSGGD